jgi:hypothetical protein
MSNPAESKEFMLILRGGIHPKDLRPEQIQELMTKFGEWMAQMQSRGQMKGAGRLEDEGRRLSRKQGQIVVDGPYVESKETVGGYFLISAPDLAQALEIGKLCPILDNEGTVEVRPLMQSPQG